MGRYRPEIDGLRAFAVVAVIINHFNQVLLPSGYLGVDIFFVISGYVITSSLAGRESRNFLDFLTGFYERRIKRLVPALVVFVLITSLLICFFNPAPETALRTGAFSLFGFSNVFLFQESTDYFAKSTQLNPFTHTWSLGVEEQFYLLFPLLIWFSGFGKQTPQGARNLFFLVGAFTIASLLGFIYLYQVNQPAAYFLMPTRFWEMAAGCLVFIGFQKRARIEQALEQVPPLLIVAVMTAIMFRPIGGRGGTIVIVILAAVLIACLKKGTAAYQFFTHEKVVYVGLISYSLYLWHWSVLSISRYTVGIHWWSVPIQILAMFLLANLSYTKVERLRYSGIWARFSILYGLLITGIASLFLMWVYSFSQKLYLSSLVSDEWQYGSHWKGWSDCSYFKFPSINKSDSVCKKAIHNSVIPSIFVIGDSHAGHIATATKRASHELGLSIVTGFAAGCYPGISYGQTSPRCNDTNNAINWGLRSDSVKTFILTGYHNLAYQGRLHENLSSPYTINQIQLDALENGVDNLIARILAAEKKVILVIGSHELIKNPSDVVLPLTWTSSAQALNVPASLIKRRNRDMYAYVERLKKKYESLQVIFLADLFCDRKYCHAFDSKGRMFFQSQDHLAPHASDYIAPVLKAELIKASR